MSDCYGYCKPNECRCRPCQVCAEPTMNDRICRDCEIERLMSDVLRCPCGHMIWGELARKLGTGQPHTETCPHADTGAYDVLPDVPQEMDPIQAAYAAGYRAGRTSVKEGTGQ